MQLADYLYEEATAKTDTRFLGVPAAPMVPDNLNTIRVDAFKMARSGAFVNAEAILVELQRRGYQRTELALKDPNVLAHLEQLCLANWNAGQASQPSQSADSAAEE
jgi:hypothetical protein